MKATYLFLHFFFLCLITSGLSFTDTDRDINKDMILDRSKCLKMRRDHKIRPGKDWGSLDETGQQLWIFLKCDRFFCRPDKKMGRGSYRCMPLKGIDNINQVD